MTTFTHPVAVDAWDAWFRWRERGELRDFTIDETWRRIADALAAAEPGDGPAWGRRFFETFAQWRLLPDESLLRHGGVPGNRHRPRARRASLNVAVFISAPHTPAARFELPRFEETAALAVRLLDDAAGGAFAPAPRALRIGLIGMADALAQLGVPYHSRQARQHVGNVAAALARGCLEGAIRLAAERGPTRADAARLAQRWQRQELPAALIEQGLRWGVKYARLTAIEPQPRLALLANNVADALDPCSARTADARADNLAAITAAPANARPEPIAQLALRAAAQRWIDAPIDYPLLAPAALSPRLQIVCAKLALRHGLPAPRWRAAAPGGR